MGNLMGKVTGLESTLTQKTESAKGVFAGLQEKASGVGANFTSGLSAFKDKVSGTAAEAAAPAAGGRGRRRGKSKRKHGKSKKNKSKHGKTKSKKNKKKRVRFSRRTRSRRY